MNYTALIENRKSVRAFRSTPVPTSAIRELQMFFDTDCHRLVHGLPVRLLVLGTEAREALEGSAGYEDFLIGAPSYLVLLSDPHPHAAENAGYIMEELILKLLDMGLDSCFLTFSDEEKVRTALQIPGQMHVAAMAAFGYGQKLPKKLRLNIFTMSNIDIIAREQYTAPKKNAQQLVSLETVGNQKGLDKLMDLYSNMLWQSFQAVSLAPSYLNRQPYAFLVKGTNLLLLQAPDPYTDEWSAKLNIGIAILHFSAVATQWLGHVKWDLDPDLHPELPEGYSVAAVHRM